MQAKQQRKTHRPATDLSASFGPPSTKRSRAKTRFYDGERQEDDLRSSSGDEEEPRLGAQEEKVQDVFPYLLVFPRTLPLVDMKLQCLPTKPRCMSWTRRGQAHTDCFILV